MIKTKQSIAIFSAYIPPHIGGVERYTSNLVKQLSLLGYHPIIITSNYNNEANFEQKDNITIIRLPIYNSFKNRYPIIKYNYQTKNLLKILNNYEVKRIIVNTRFYFTSIIGVNYANKHKIPVFLIEHGSNYVTLDNKFIDFFANRYEDILTLYLKNKVTGFYGVSNACGAWLKKFNIKSSGTWYNSIDIKENNIKKTKHKEINFLYAGRIIKQKGVYNILISFTNLLTKYNNINLYIAGNGPDLETYKKDFSNPKIHFLGKLDYNDLLKYYASCDIFLYPPLWPEGLPTSILEAGMMKCAVIATNQGGIKEIITNKENGLIISNDINDLELSMEKLILNKNLRNNYANNLYSTIKHKFSWEVTAKKIITDMNLDKKTSNKKKVLHLLASNNYSGAENVVCTIISNCSTNYDMYYCSPDGPIYEILTNKNINFIPLKKLSIKEVKKVIKEYNIDLIHAHDFKASFITIFLKTKTISQLHCNYKLLPCKTIIGLIYSIIQKKYKKIIIVSNNILEEAIFKNRIKNKTVVIENVLDKNNIVEKSNEFITPKYDLIFLGRLIDLKQPLLFIDIVKQLTKDNKKIKACIIGNGPLYQECKKRITSNNLTKNIELLGFKENPFPYLKNSKIMLLPSKYEGLPMSVIESMCLGTLVINSGVGELSHMYKNYPQYICHNKEEYINCLNILLNQDKDSYEKTCHNIINKYIDTKEYKNKLLKVYEEVLK